MAIENKTALAELFQHYGPGLIRFLNQKVKSPEDAEDIAQNAFIRIHRIAKAGQLDNLKAYLYQTASNLVIDQARRDKLHHNYLQQESAKHNVEDEPQKHVDYCTPERLLTAQQELDSLKKALDKLPVKCRQAFMLHRKKGLSYTEIAHEMSVSVSSVEKYILQALKACRKALEDNQV